MSYCGWVELTFQLNTGPVLHVPFLVTKDEFMITETVELIQASGCDTIASVHSEKKDVVIGPGQRCLVKCKVPVGILEESTAVVFEQDEIQ